MIPTIAFTGSSGSGKTTLVEKVIALLVERNYRVGTIKHHVKELDVDREGKDSWRHKKAGAVATVIATPTGLAAIRSLDGEATPLDIVERYLYDAHIAIIEGYKHGNVPGIAVFRESAGEPFKLTGKTVAVATDTEVDAGDLPRFHIDDAVAVADFIERKFILEKSKRRVHLFVDGKTVPMKNFVRDILEMTIRGLISAFRGTEGAKKITVIIDE